MLFLGGAAIKAQYTPAPYAGVKACSTNGSSGLKACSTLRR